MQSVEEIWRKYDAMEVRLAAPLSERMVELARIRPGMHVLDLATGRGEPAILAARRVGPEGSVLGVDVSEPMLKMARERAELEGIRNLELKTGDAASLRTDKTFDAALCRWGLMFVERPLDALIAAKRVMKPGALLVVAVWTEPERVSWYSSPRRALKKFRTLPPIDPNAPGTFYYAAPEKLREHLRRAGFRAEHEEELDLPVMEAATGEELVAWARAFGMNRLLEGLPDETQRAWEQDFIRAEEPRRSKGLFHLGGVTRLYVSSA